MNKKRLPTSRYDGKMTLAEGNRLLNDYMDKVDRLWEREQTVPPQTISGDPETIQETIVKPNHYSVRKIDPIEYCNVNGLDFVEGNIVKYVTRWRDKDGIKDLEKLVYYAMALLKREQKKLEDVEE